MLVKINGSMPYCGVDAVDAQVLPNINLKNPILSIAGKPEIIR